MKKRSLIIIGMAVVLTIAMVFTAAADDNMFRRDMSGHGYFYVTYPEEEFTYREDYNQLKNSKNTTMTFDPMFNAQEYEELKGIYADKYSSYDNYKLEETTINGCNALVMQYEDWLGGNVHVSISFGETPIQPEGGSEVYGMGIGIAGNSLDDCYADSVWNLINSFEVEGLTAVEPVTEEVATEEPATEEAAEPEPEGVVFSVGDREYIFNPQFSDDDTRAMNSFMKYGYAVVVDDCIYGNKGFSEQAVAKRSVEEGSYPNVDLTATEFIGPDDVSPYLFTYYDGYIYGAMHAYNNCPYDGIFRLNPETDEFEIIYAGRINEYMQVFDGWIYFCDTDNNYCRVDLDGLNFQVVIGDKAVYYPYQIGDGYVVFQDDADGEKLHLFHEGGLDVAITSKRSYEPVLVGDYIYFMAKDPGEDEGVFARVNIRTMEEEFGENYIQYYFIDGGNIYSPDNPVTPIDDWKNLKNVPDMNYGYGYVVYADSKYQISNSVNDEGKFSGRTVWGKNEDGTPYYMGAGY